MNDWSLDELLQALHEDIEHKLLAIRRTMVHPCAKGDGSEKIWLELLCSYLPQRYKVARAHIVDSKGDFSQQQDIVIFDRQYSPFVFNYVEQIIIPAESVYAVFEVKQSVNQSAVKYAQEKVESVRKLHRTSSAIPHAGGTYPAKQPNHIVGGILTLESEWNPPLGNSFIEQLQNNTKNGLLDMGCVAGHGNFYYDEENNYFSMNKEGKAATVFLFKLISKLQSLATVPMIDIEAYAEWLH